jgi:hypothetical protein
MIEQILNVNLFNRGISINYHQEILYYVEPQDIDQVFLDLTLDVEVAKLMHHEHWFGYRSAKKKIVK